MLALVPALANLAASLTGIVVKAIADSSATHETILAEAQAAVAAFQAAVASLPQVLASDDATADAEAAALKP